MQRILTVILVSFIIAACTPESPPISSDVNLVTAIPTLDMNNARILCDAVDRHWAIDWDLTVYALSGLININAQCSSFVPTEQLYRAWILQGAEAAKAGNLELAASAYTNALTMDPTRDEALQLLASLTPTPPQRTSCESAVVTRSLEMTPEYTPSDGDFVTLDGNRFTIGGDIFTVFGVNYYPRDTPFWRFLTQTDVNNITDELALIKSAGINTVRIFLRYDDLFICPDDGAIPHIENLTRLDDIIQAIARQGLKIIAVLNHEAHLSEYSIYELPEISARQTAYLVERYRDEPAILAWDLRDRGDLDYSERGNTREQTLDWLRNISNQIRAIDPNHLITAGWWKDAGATAPLVDFVSFQHFGSFADLRQNIAIYRDQTQKPLLMTAVGYSTLHIDETAQRNLLFQSFDESTHTGLLGWNIYMAFDYPMSVTCIEPLCPSEPSETNFYGIWNTSYFPKLALDAVQRMTGTN